MLQGHIWRRLRPSCTRSVTSKSPVITTDTDSNGIVTLTMQNGPINIFDYELARSMRDTLREVEGARGLIITSAYERTFTAGLDMTILSDSSNDKFREWWSDLQQIFLTLYGSSAPSVAAITGYGAGFGTLLACACEYRIMVENGENCKNDLLGYHEVKFGYNPPPWFLLALSNVVPRHAAEQASLQGTLFSPRQSLRLGLVDELASNNQDALNKSKLWLRQFAKMPLDGRTATKRLLRAEGLNYIKDNGAADVLQTQQATGSESYRTALAQYLKSKKFKT